METQDQKWVEFRMKELQKSIDIDWDNPPTEQIYQIKEATCHAQLTSFCNAMTEFRMTHRLTRPDGKGVGQEAPKYTIYPKIAPQHSPKNNLGDSPLFLSVEKATTLIDMKSKGWNAGAQLSMPFGNTGASVTLSGSYHEEETKGATKSSSEGFNWECPRFHRCEIQDWTLHLQVEGICDRIPTIKRCEREIDPCYNTEDLECDQYISFGERECSSSGGYRQEKCTVRTPLLNYDGTPVTETVYIMTKLEVAPAPRVVGVLEDWLKLDNGKLFNQVSQKFKDSGNGKEYSSEDEPKPELPEGAKVTQVKGSLLLLNNGYWLDADTGNQRLSQAPRVTGFTEGGWLKLDNDQFYRPETDEFWDPEIGAPRHNPELIRPSVPKGTKVVGLSNGWVKIKGGSWLQPDFGLTLPPNTTTDELQRHGISTRGHDTKSPDLAYEGNVQDDGTDDDGTDGDHSGQIQNEAPYSVEETSPEHRDLEAEEDFTPSEERSTGADVDSNERVIAAEDEDEDEDAEANSNHDEDGGDLNDDGSEMVADSAFGSQSTDKDSSDDYTPVDKADKGTMCEDRQGSCCGPSCRRGGGASAASRYVSRVKRSVTRHG